MGEHLRVRGVVASFDVARGDGVVVSDEGESLYFHCVEILNGTRRVDEGARVHGERRVGHLGADELGAIEIIAEREKRRATFG